MNSRIDKQMNILFHAYPPPHTRTHHAHYTPPHPHLPPAFTTLYPALAATHCCPSLPVGLSYMILSSPVLSLMVTGSQAPACWPTSTGASGMLPSTWHCNAAHRTLPCRCNFAFLFFCLCCCTHAHSYRTPRLLRTRTTWANSSAQPARCRTRCSICVVLTLPHAR